MLLRKIVNGAASVGEQPSAVFVLSELAGQLGVSLQRLGAVFTVLEALQVLTCASLTTRIGLLVLVLTVTPQVDVCVGSSMCVFAMRDRRLKACKCAGYSKCDFATTM